MQVLRKLDKAGNATKTFNNWITYFKEKFLNIPNRGTWAKTSLNFAVPSTLLDLKRFFGRSGNEEFWKNLSDREIDDIEEIVQKFEIFLTQIKVSKFVLQLHLDRPARQKICSLLTECESVEKIGPLANFSPFNKRTTSISGTLSVANMDDNNIYHIFKIYPFLRKKGLLVNSQYLIYNKKHPYTENSLDHFKTCKSMAHNGLNIDVCEHMIKGASEDCALVLLNLSEKSNSCEFIESKTFSVTPFDICESGSTDIIVSSPNNSKITINCNGYITMKKIKKGNNKVDNVINCKIETADGKQLLHLPHGQDISVNSPLEYNNEFNNIEYSNDGEHNNVTYKEAKHTDISLFLVFDVYPELLYLLLALLLFSLIIICFCLNLCIMKFCIHCFNSPLYKCPSRLTKPQRNKQYQGRHSRRGKHGNNGTNQEHRSFMLP